MPTKGELYERAQELDIEGRSDMDKDELEAAIAEAERAEPEQTQEPVETQQVVATDDEGQQARTDVSQTARERQAVGQPEEGGQDDQGT